MQRMVPSRAKGFTEAFKDPPYLSIYFLWFCVSSKLNLMLVFQVGKVIEKLIKLAEKIIQAINEN